MNKILGLQESQAFRTASDLAGSEKTAGKTQRMVYWLTTSLIAFALLSGGGAELARQHDTVAGTLLLGYPVYFVTILGFWKVLGAVALLAPRFPRLKEWAYAGVFFNMTGAAASHAFAGDYGKGAFHIIVPSVFAILVLVSWASRPPTRKLAGPAAAAT